MVSAINTVAGTIPVYRKRIPMKTMPGMVCTTEIIGRTYLDILGSLDKRIPRAKAMMKPMDTETST